MILSALLPTKYTLAYLRCYMYMESKQQEADSILQVVAAGSNLDTVVPVSEALHDDSSYEMVIVLLHWQK